MAALDLKTIVPTAATLLIAAAGGWYALTQMRTENQTLLTDRLLLRVENLEFQVAELVEENTQYRIENARLKVDIGILRAQVTGEGSPVRAVYDFLDDMKGVPAWCKQVEVLADGVGIVFRASHISAAYEHEYDISAALFIGLTDFELAEATSIISMEIARDWYTNDLLVYARKSLARYTEMVPPSGTRDFWKFYHNPDGTDVELLCGFEIID